MYTYLFFDVSAVCVMATLILALINRKLTKGRNNMLFLALCTSIFISGVLDIATEYFNHMPGISIYYTMLRAFLDSMFFIVHNGTAPLYFVYICSVMGLWYQFVQRQTLFHAIIIPYLADVILVIVNLFTGVVFHYEGGITYVHGPLIYALYGIAAYYFFVCLYVLIRYKRLVSASRFVSLVAFLVVNASSVLIQFLFPSYRIELMMSAVLTIIVSACVHRPEEVVDSLLDIQSHKAFLETVHTNYLAESPTNYLFIKFDNYSSLRKSLGIDNYFALLRIVSTKLENICKAMMYGFENYYLDQGTFAIVAGVNKYNELLDCGRTIMAYLQEPIMLSHMEARLNAHICIVKTPEDINNEESLLNFSGTFHKKLPNENRVFALSSISASKEFRMRNDMERIIKRGIEEHGFEMYYQPIYSVSKKKFVSAEALIRLKDSKYGFVSPGLFIPEAEASGAIHDIGDFVIEDVCRFIGSQDFDALGLEYIEINLSVAQLIENNLYQKVFDYMEKYGVKPSQLNLEITETAADYAPEVTDVNIARLSEAGLTFSLDDYGTGYSNITRVVSLPLNIVKLDKTLVDDMDTPLMWIVIKNTVNMLKKMNKKILVEGIEDERSLERFIEIGCDYIQGYYFSKPLPANEYLEFISKKNFTRQ